MKIEPIIKDTTRFLYSIEDKLSITSLVLFCYKSGSLIFSELLYTSNHEKFISDLELKYKDYEINLKVNLADKEVKKALIKTIEVLREKEDTDNYFKLLYDKDPFAIMIEKMSGGIVKLMN